MDKWVSGPIRHPEAQTKAVGIPIGKRVTSKAITRKPKKGLGVSKTLRDTKGSVDSKGSHYVTAVRMS